MARLIITGASGQLARRVADDVLARRQPSELILVTRHPATLADFAARGVEVRQADFDAPDRLHAAFAGGSRLLLVSTNDLGRREAQHRAAIVAAVQARIAHIIYTSCLSPDPPNPAVIAPSHAFTEKFLIASGVKWTVLRNSLYADYQVSEAAQALATGQLRHNRGAGKVAYVSRHDCAAVAGAVLASDGHDGAIYDVTGPEAYDAEALAALYTLLGGRQVEPVMQDDAAFVAGIVATSADNAHARYGAELVASFGASIRAPYDVLHDVRRLHSRGVHGELHERRGEHRRARAAVPAASARAASAVVTPCADAYWRRRSGFGNIATRLQRDDPTQSVSPTSPAGCFCGAHRAASSRPRTAKQSLRLSWAPRFGSNRMKAVRLAKPGGLDNLALVDMDAPGDPGPGEIRVRIRASSLNFHDFAVAMGFIPAADGRIPMADGAGVVEAVGAGVTELAVGDHVVSVFFPTWQAGPALIGDFTTTPGDGIDGYAREQVVKPATWFTKAPKGWSHAEAATITTAGLTAWRALVVDGGLKAGDTVLVLGTGGVSIYALQLARAMGATVIATSSSDQKLERVRALGAEHTINYKTTPEWGRRVLELTGGRGADVVVEVGGSGTLPQSIRAARVGGHIALIGVLTGRAGEIPTALLMAKQQNVRGLIVGSRAHQIDFVRALEATGLKPVIDKTFALAQLADAFRHEASGQHFGKICVEI